MGAKLTVSVAAVVLTVPRLFVNTARYWFPFCEALVVKVRVVEVAPDRLLNVAPPSMLTCHCTVGVGVPLAAAVKLTLAPAVTVWLVGLVVTTGGAGAELTVKVAAVVVALPTELVNTARNWFPFCDRLAVNV